MSFPISFIDLYDATVLLDLVIILPFSELLLMKMIDVVKMMLNKNELRYLMKKFKLPEDKVAEIEQAYYGKDKLQDRIYHSLLYWKEYRGPLATLDELIRVFHIIGYTQVCNKLKTMKIYSQRLRF